jgi:hypothetical protein
VLEAVAAVAGAGHTRGNLTLHAVGRRPVKDTLVAVAPEAASLLASALFGAAKITEDVDALVLEDPFRFGLSAKGTDDVLPQRWASTT